MKITALVNMSALRCWLYTVVADLLWLYHYRTLRHYAHIALHLCRDCSGIFGKSWHGNKESALKKDPNSRQALRLTQG